MKQYKLLKDLPTFKAGDLFYISEYGALVHDGVMAYARQTLDMFPNILTEWFEEIQEESTDSIHWKPVIGEEYWLVYADGDIGYGVCTGSYWDTARYKMGSVYRTEKEAEKARDRRLAEVRLRQTSNFKPDFKNRDGGWIVTYDHSEERLEVEECSLYDSGEPVRYETEEDAQKSIDEHEKEWLAYFGVKEEI